MSKIYKGTIYINDINGMYDNDGDIETELQNGLYDASLYIDNLIEVDTTEYIEKVEDNYEWNTIDKKKCIKEMNKFIEKNKNKEV